jgi:hypothetical protein
VEAGFFESATRTDIVDVRIDRNQRSSLVDQLLGQKPQEGRAMTLAHHVCFADECVDCPRALRERLQVRMGPGMYAVMLRISKGPAMEGDDLHGHPGFL